jgi:tetratricopeptide (TPR) repeat protein
MWRRLGVCGALLLALACTAASEPGKTRPDKTHKPLPLEVTHTVAPSAALESAWAALTAASFDEALTGYEQLLKARPHDLDALLGIAYLAHRAGQRAAAQSYYRGVLRQDPQHPVAQAGLLALSGEPDLIQTASRARDLAESHPESGAPLAALGAILVKQGRLADAALAYDRALALEPGNAGHAYNLAVALDHLHQYPQAQAHYQRSLSLADGHSRFSRPAVTQRLEQLRAGMSHPEVTAP